MISSGRLHFRYIAVEGPIGVGKTTLAERLGTRLDATVVLEEIENPFLADFYADRPGAALQAQLFYLLNRHRQQTALRQADLFSQIDGLRLPLRQGQDLRVSESRRQRAVHLSAALRSARARRPAARSRDLPAGADRRAAAPPSRPSPTDPEAAAFEPDPDYLKELNEAYHHFFFHYNATPLLVVETSQFDSGRERRSARRPRQADQDDGRRHAVLRPAHEVIS